MNVSSSPSFQPSAFATPSSADTYALGKEFPRIAETTLKTSEDGQTVLAAVRNGDKITIDLKRCILEVDLEANEITKRLEALPPFEQKVTSSYLRRYAALVTSANTGAVLRKM